MHVKAAASRQQKRDKACQAREVTSNEWGGGIFQAPKIAMMARIRKVGAPDSVSVQAVNLEQDERGKPTHAYITLGGMRLATSGAWLGVNTGCGKVNGKKHKLTANQQEDVPGFLFHGTDEAGMVEILKNTYLASSNDQGVQTFPTLDRFGEAGQNHSFVVKCSTTAYVASKETRKQIKHPVPGVAIGNALHPDSLEVVGFYSPLHVILPWVGCQVANCPGDRCFSFTRKFTCRGEGASAQLTQVGFTTCIRT